MDEKKANECLSLQFSVQSIGKKCTATNSVLNIRLSSSRERTVDEFSYSLDKSTKNGNLIAVDQLYPSRPIAVILGQVE